MSDVFISYAAQDSMLVEEIAAALERAGYTTWYYGRDSVAGPVHVVTTGREIDACQAVLLLVTGHSLPSNQVTRELLRSQEVGRHIVPLLRGVTYEELQRRQEVWREILVGATAISIDSEGVQGALPRLLDGLEALDIHPGGTARRRGQGVDARRRPAPLRLEPVHGAGGAAALRRARDPFPAAAPVVVPVEEGAANRNLLIAALAIGGGVVLVLAAMVVVVASMAGRPGAAVAPAQHPPPREHASSPTPPREAVRGTSDPISVTATTSPPERDSPRPVRPKPREFRTEGMVKVRTARLKRGWRDESVTVRLIRRYGSGVQALLDVPPRTVTVRSFYIDKYEVTNARYAEFLKAVEKGGRFAHPDQPPDKKDYTPKFWSDAKFNAPGQPVIGLDWYDAWAYANWARKRLLTEDEWELAARGMDGRPYPWGDEYRAEFCEVGVGGIARPVAVTSIPSARPDAPIGMAGNAATWTSTSRKGEDVIALKGGAWDLRPAEAHAVTFSQAISAPSKTARDCSVGLRCGRDTSAGTAAGMIRVQGARVRLGGDDTPLVRLMRELKGNIKDLRGAFLDYPTDDVRVESFRIDRCEVSNAEYREFLEYVKVHGDDELRHPDQPAGQDHTPAHWNDPSFNRDRQPVVGVDWYDAYACARWAGKRLPSNDEWELAARGTTSRLYPWGDTFDRDRCVCAESGASAPAEVTASPTGQSTCGILNMTGNASEWTADDHTENSKCVRGGSWGESCRLFGVTYLRKLVGAQPTYRGKDVGFRCVADAR